MRLYNICVEGSFKQLCNYVSIMKHIDKHLVKLFYKEQFDKNRLIWQKDGKNSIIMR